MSRNAEPTRVAAGLRVPVQPEGRSRMARFGVGRLPRRSPREAGFRGPAPSGRGYRFPSTATFSVPGSAVGMSRWVGYANCSCGFFANSAIIRLLIRLRTLPTLR